MAWVAGCDRGIGFALAQHLDTLGYHVVAGCLCREGSGARNLQRSTSPRLATIQLDVQDHTQIAQAAITVQQLLTTGKRRLYIVCPYQCTVIKNFSM